MSQRRELDALTTSLCEALQAGDFERAGALLDARPEPEQQAALSEASCRDGLLLPTLRLLADRRRCPLLLLGKAIATWQRAWTYREPTERAEVEAALRVTLAHLPSSLRDQLQPAIASNALRRAVRAIGRGQPEDASADIDALGPLALAAFAFASIDNPLEPPELRRVLALHRSDERAPWLASLLFVGDALGGASHTRRALSVYAQTYGAAGVPPVCALLERTEHPGAPQLYAWIAEQAPDVAEPRLLEGLESRTAAAREVCAKALAHRPGIVAPVLALLASGSPAVRESVAMLLELRADPTTEPPIEAALARERSAKARSALQRALSQVRLRTASASVTAPRDEGVALEQRLAVVEPGALTLDVTRLPPITYRDGRAISSHVRAVLASRLLLEDERREDPLVDEIVAAIDPESLAGWTSQLESPFAKARVAGPQELDALGTELARGRADRGWSRALLAFARRDHPIVRAWLGHIAMRGAGRAAREHALERLVAIPGALDRLAEPPPAWSQAYACWLAHIEERMIRQQPVATPIPGLLYAFGQELRLCVAPDEWVDEAGAPAQPAGVGLVVHPAMLPGAVIDRWTALIAARGLQPPFAQLDRPAGRLGREAALERVRRLLPLRVPLDRLGKLVHAIGYVDGPVFDYPGSSPIIVTSERRIGPDLRFVLHHTARFLRPGVDRVLADMGRQSGEEDDSGIERVEVLEGLGDPPTSIELERLSRPLACELANDVLRLAAARRKG